MRFISQSAVAILLATTLASGAGATATQGTLGATSQGSITISASVPNRIEISGLTDVSFLNQDPSTAASNAQSVCVWSNTSTHGYNVKASGSGTSSAFTLSNGSGTVPYSVEWAASSGQSSGTALTAATALTGLTSNATSPDCSSGPTASASLIVKMTAANLQTMQAASTYTGTLTLLVAPE